MAQHFHVAALGASKPKPPRDPHVPAYLYNSGAWESTIRKYREGPRTQLGATPLLERCPDTSRCPPLGQNRTVFKIEGGEINAAFGNLFYSVVVNGVLYATHKGHVPWISFELSWVYKTMGKEWQKDGPLWDRFFEPYCQNVSAWLHACSNVHLAKLKTKTFYYPHIQQRFKWPVRQWYNMNSLEHAWCQYEGWCGKFNATFYSRWRRDAHAVVSRAHRLRPSMESAVEERWRELNPSQRRPVLAMHMRGSDKASNRLKTNASWYVPYISSFKQTHPDGLIVVATEDAGFASMINSKWRAKWGRESFALANISTRVRRKKPNFAGDFDKMVVAHDVLLDIQVMARADYFLHTSSAVAEATIYTNPKLHCNSINLEMDHDAPHDAPWLPWQGRPRSGCDEKRAWVL